MHLTAIKLCRLHRDLLQVDVAHRARIPRARLSEIENGHVEPHRTELERLADVFACSVDALRSSSAHSQPTNPNTGARARRRKGENHDR